MYNSNKVVRNILGDRVSKNNELFNSQVTEVQNFDEIVQQRNLKQLERSLAHIYNTAKGNDYGWGGIAKQDPNKFRAALTLVRSNSWVK